MYKSKEFFGNLSKSTRLTVISCGIFIILTFIILMFFVMFPITPSEKVISGMGRAGLMDSDGKNSPYGDELNGVVVTTSADSSGKKNDSKVTTANTQVTYPKVHYVDKIFTTNEGYVYTGYAVPTGQPGYNSYNYNSNQTVTQAVEHYEEPVYTEPPQSYEPEPQQPETSETDEPSEPTAPEYSEPDVPDTSYDEPDVPEVTDPPVIDEPSDVDPPYSEPDPIPSDEPSEPSDEPEL